MWVAVEDKTAEVRYRGGQVARDGQARPPARIGSGERRLVNPMETPPSVDPGGGIPGRLLLTQRGCQETRKRPLGCLRLEFRTLSFMGAPTTPSPPRPRTSPVRADLVIRAPLNVPAPSPRRERRPRSRPCSVVPRAAVLLRARGLSRPSASFFDPQTRLTKIRRATLAQVPRSPLGPRLGYPPFPHISFHPRHHVSRGARVRHGGSPQPALLTPSGRAAFRWKAAQRRLPFGDYPLTRPLAQPAAVISPAAFSIHTSNSMRVPPASCCSPVITPCTVRVSPA